MTVDIPAELEQLEHTADLPEEERLQELAALLERINSEMRQQ